MSGENAMKERIKVMIIGQGVKAGVYMIHKNNNESDIKAVHRHFGNHVSLLEVMKRKVKADD